MGHGTDFRIHNKQNEICSIDREFCLFQNVPLDFILQIYVHSTCVDKTNDASAPQTISFISIAGGTSDRRNKRLLCFQKAIEKR